MKIIIIEDEKRAANYLLKLIDDLDLDIQVIASLNSVKESIEWLTINSFPDLMISDIELGDGKVFDRKQH